MSLADRIINKNSSDPELLPWGELDEYGLPVRLSGHVDYTVARIIIRNPDICVNPDDGRIYLTNSIDRIPVNETSRTVVELSNFSSPFKGDKAAIVFNRLKELLPKADTKSVMVGDGLIFDGETHSLKETLTKAQTEQRYRDITALLNELDKEKEK